MSKPDEPLRFRNYYKCPQCGTEWHDDWSATCDDQCPNCDTSCSPVRSEDLPAYPDLLKETFASMAEVFSGPQEKLTEAQIAEVRKEQGPFLVVT